MNFKTSFVLLCVTQYAMAVVEYDVVDDTEDVRRTDPEMEVHEMKQSGTGGKLGKTKLSRELGQRRGNANITNNNSGKTSTANQSVVAKVKLLGKETKLQLENNIKTIGVPHNGPGYRPVIPIFLTKPMGKQSRLRQRNKVKTIHIGDFKVTFELIEDNFGTRKYQMAGNEEESVQRRDDLTEINNDQPLNEAMALVDMENK